MGRRIPKYGPWRDRRFLSLNDDLRGGIGKGGGVPGKGGKHVRKILSEPENRVGKLGIIKRSLSPLRISYVTHDDGVSSGVSRQSKMMNIKHNQ